MNKRIFFIIFGVEFRKITLLQYCILLCVFFSLSKKIKTHGVMLIYCYQYIRWHFSYHLLLLFIFKFASNIQLKRHHQENETTKSLTITNVDQLRKQLKELMRRVLVFDTNITVALFVLLIYNGTTRKFYTSFFDLIQTIHYIR